MWKACDQMFADLILTESVMRLPLDLPVELPDGREHFLLILEGTGCFLAGEEAVSFGKNDCFYLPDGTGRIQPADVRGGAALLIGFRVNSRRLKEALSVMPRRIPKECASASQTARSLLVSLTGNPDRTHADFHVLQLLYWGAGYASGKGEIAPDPKEEAAGRLDAYVREHLRGRISVESAAQDLHCAESAVKNMAQAKGVSFQKYVQAVRLEKARDMLILSGSSITEIAEQCGFSSVHYFSRYFKEREGVSPREYRENAYRTWNFNEQGG